MRLGFLKKALMFLLALYALCASPIFSKMRLEFQNLDKKDIDVKGVIDLSIEDCFQTIITKIDTVIVPEMVSVESKLDQWIMPVDESILSLIDAINNETFEYTDPCCETLSSTLDALAVSMNTIIIKAENKVEETRLRRLDKGDVITHGANLITKDGLYFLKHNVNGCVIIDADKVTIDMQGFTIYCDQPNAVIEVLAGHNNIEIKNGQLQGASNLSNDGILIGAGCEYISLEEVNIYSCAKGLYFNGTLASPIQMCDITHCQMDECSKGVLLSYANSCVFENCGAYNCIQAGFEQQYCQFNVYDICEALETSNSGSSERAVGFSSSGGTGNLYTECVAEGTKKTVESNFDYGAIGFLLTGTVGDMETETKIINCIANSTSVLSTDTLADAYGIKIEPVILSGDDLLAKLKSVYFDFSIYSANWSSDRNYLAVGGDGSGQQLMIYRFDGSDLLLIRSVDYGSGASAVIYSVDWSSDGKFLTIGCGLAGNQIQVYSFDGSSLLLIDSISYGAIVRSVNWSSDGQYLAVGGADLVSGDEIQVYSFDGSHVSSAPISSVDYGSVVYSVNWSPDGRYLAVGGGNPVSGDEIQVYSFDGSKLSSTPISSVNYGNSVRSVNWSPNGRYLAVGGYNLVSGDEIQAYSFNGSSLSFAPISSVNYGDDVYSVNWSPDGRYLAVGGDYLISGGEVRVYSFDNSSFSSMPIGSADYGYGVSVSWSPNGKYLVAVGFNTFGILSAMDATSNCLIDSNKVCNTGNGVLSGVGILASGENSYIKNTLYSNDVHFNKGVIPRYGNMFGPQFVGTGSILNNVFVGR